MTAARRLLLGAMFCTCSAIDRLPDWTWRIPGLHRLGCPRGLALWAFALEERWFGPLPPYQPKDEG